MADRIKLTLSALIFGGGIVAFYIFADYPLWMRVLGMLVIAGISLTVAAQAEVGRQALDFFKESRTELRKVVWPTRKETVQTTLIVLAMVIVVAIILWILDMFLLWAVKLLTGQGG
ncbi:MAG: preprotein translocase subunit SecE [Gammaproteobacteria bacterium RBG_16_57_12]|nr:MAG: preprotein translocase subunit SecE [Gammaproteobacteria bacterium RBG_16_57_12]